MKTSFVMTGAGGGEGGAASGVRGALIGRGEAMMSGGRTAAKPRDSPSHFQSTSSLEPLSKTSLTTESGTLGSTVAPLMEFS